MVRAAALVVALFSASPVYAADQFDLVCTGKVESTISRPEPISRRYHVDLAAKRWCYNECTVRPIVEVNNTQIVFRDTKAAYEGDPTVSLDYVDRTTAKWVFFSAYEQGEGTCAPAPFSGFPSAPAKF
jgi:hypothetical protein